MVGGYQLTLAWIVNLLWFLRQAPLSTFTNEEIALSNLCKSAKLKKKGNLDSNQSKFLKSTSRHLGISGI